MKNVDLISVNEGMIEEVLFLPSIYFQYFSQIVFGNFYPRHLNTLTVAFCCFFFIKNHL